MDAGNAWILRPRVQMLYQIPRFATLRGTALEESKEIRGEFFLLSQQDSALACDVSHIDQYSTHFCLALGLVGLGKDLLEAAKQKGGGLKN